MNQELSALILRSKMDYERLEAVRMTDLCEIPEIIPHLLEWTQDLNWPVAIPIIEKLLAYPVFPIFTTQDGIWKDNVIQYYIRELSLEYKTAFTEELVRIVENPTDDEIDDEVVKSAASALEEINQFLLS
ncbi:hypothetical protein DNH61_02625 [Paenibacillus sambharensis]|uniref:DUF5071 domain-containing protein n=1 Tax=Paenibacillus sambharensis TaxID=1803190 RepID=A0A2W1LGT1_9BACL|nr:DUF5071 domain-containing protein [Paenibacillus sambharensis]PZD97270.1 hypothetical protein DNH61_02625 [Paenibacillus sambharensis]